MFENNLIRANQNDIEFYEKLLYPLQDEIFTLIQTERFYLSGGTCLSRFYYNHRYSEELDFKQVAKWSEYKVVPLDYEGAVMAFADQELEGTVLIKRDISLEDFENFVEKLIKRMLHYAKQIS